MSLSTPPAGSFTAQNLVAAPRELRSERLVLHAPSLEFAELRAASIAASSAAYDFIAWWRKAADLEVMQRSCASEVASVERGDELIYHAFLRADSDGESGAYVGRIDLHTWDVSVPRCELGYMGDSRLAGKGLMHEAASTCLALAFALGALRVQAVTDTRNLRSIAFAEGLGFTREGVLRAYERDADGAVCDQLMLAIVARTPKKLPSS